MAQREDNLRNSHVPHMALFSEIPDVGAHSDCFHFTDGQSLERVSNMSGVSTTRWAPGPRALHVHIYAASVLSAMTLAGSSASALVGSSGRAGRAHTLQTTSSAILHPQPSCVCVGEFALSHACAWVRRGVSSSTQLWGPVGVLSLFQSAFRAVCVSKRLLPIPWNISKTQPL